LGVEGRKFVFSQNIHKAVFCDPSNIPCRTGTVTLLQHRNEAGNKGDKRKDVESHNTGIGDSSRVAVNRVGFANNAITSVEKLPLLL
jgi:hypothetical protein